MRSPGCAEPMSSLSFGTRCAFDLETMLAERSPWPTVAQLIVATTVMVGACSQDTDAKMSTPAATTTLKLGDGVEITPESLRCLYRQSTGARDELSLQLQYLSAPNHVAFAVYMTNPAPAKPFVATPGDVDSFTFEAFVDATSGYRSDLEQAEIAVHLDELPQPSALSPGDPVQLHGQLELAEFTMPAVGDDASEATLHVPAGSVAVDCEATFQRAQVLN